MTNGSAQKHRKSIRFKGYDYSQPGEYFVTICTHKRKCILGEISNMRFCPSEFGQVVRLCWDAIPEHFENACGNVVQIMPNHVHGIITIKATTHPVGAGHVQPLQRTFGKKSATPSRHQFQHILPGSLGSVVRSFKAAVAKRSLEMSLNSSRPIWQRNFYDHIIRDDTSHFFIERYIELNPVFWYLDVENPKVCDDEKNIEALKNHLRKEFGMDEAAVEYLIDNEIAYRWWKRGNRREKNL